MNRSVFFYTESGQTNLKDNYGQLRRLFSPDGNKAPPLISMSASLTVAELVEAGLARSLFRLPHIHPAVVFFCHTFCSPRTSWHIAFFRSSKKSISQSTRMAKRTSGTPTITTVPDLRQKKNNSKLLYITCSYSTFFTK